MTQVLSGRHRHSDERRADCKAPLQRRHRHPAQSSTRRICILQSSPPRNAKQRSEQQRQDQRQRLVRRSGLRRDGDNNVGAGRRAAGVRHPDAYGEGRCAFLGHAVTGVCTMLCQSRTPHAQSYRPLCHQDPVALCLHTRRSCDVSDADKRRSMRLPDACGQGAHARSKSCETIHVTQHTTLLTNCQHASVVMRQSSCCRLVTLHACTDLSACGP